MSARARCYYSTLVLHTTGTTTSPRTVRPYRGRDVSTNPFIGGYSNRLPYSLVEDPTIGFYAYSSSNIMVLYESYRTVTNTSDVAIIAPGIAYFSARLTLSV